MIDENWTKMNDLEEAFNQITTFNFMLEQLQDAVDSNETAAIVDITHALNSFYPVYVDNWDKKFKIAWDHFIVKP